MSLIRCKTLNCWFIYSFTRGTLAVPDSKKHLAFCPAARQPVWRTGWNQSAPSGALAAGSIETTNVWASAWRCKVGRRLVAPYSSPHLHILLYYAFKHNHCRYITFTQLPPLGPTDFTGHTCEFSALLRIWLHVAVKHLNLGWNIECCSYLYIFCDHTDKITWWIRQQEHWH